jgi:hypothetical protein
MARLRIMLPMLALCLAACGGGGGQVDAPFDFCAQNDGCSQGTACIPSTLPLVFNGFFCSANCNVSSDCPQDFTNFPTICVNQACYLSCPAGSNSCPYTSSCATFQDDQTGELLDLCTP